MLTKGIVEEIINEYSAKVRLPIYDGAEGSKNATAKDDLTEATICSLPNISASISVGDIVYVGFENDDISMPVILGHLQAENKPKSLANLKLGNLDAKGSVQLSSQTSIGDIRAEEISRLSGIKGNIQAKLDDLDEKTKNISGDLSSDFLQLAGGEMIGTIKLSANNDFSGSKSNPTYNNQDIILRSDLDPVINNIKADISNNYYTKTQTDERLNDLLLSMTTIDIQAPPDGLTPCVCDGEADDTANFSTLLAYASNNNYVLVQNGGILNLNTSISLTNNMRFTMNNGAIKLKYGFTYPDGAENIHVRLINVEYSSSNPIIKFGSSSSGTISGCSFYVDNLSISSSSPSYLAQCYATVTASSFVLKNANLPIKSKLINMSSGSFNNTCSMTFDTINYYIPDGFSSTTIQGLLTTQATYKIDANITASNINLPTDFTSITKDLTIYLSHGVATSGLVTLVAAALKGWKAKFNSAYIYGFYYTSSASASIYNIDIRDIEIEFTNNKSIFCLFYYYYLGVYIYSGEVSNIKVKNGNFNISFSYNSSNSNTLGAHFIMPKATSATSTLYTISIHDIDIDTDGSGSVQSMVQMSSGFGISSSSTSYWGGFYIYNINVKAASFSLLRIGNLTETTTAGASALNDSSKYIGIGCQIYNINLDLITTTTNSIIAISYQYYSNRYNAGAIYISKLEVNANLLEGSTGSVYLLNCLSSIYLVYSVFKNIKFRLNNKSSTNTTTPYMIALPLSGSTLENVRLQYINLETNATYGAVYQTTGGYTTFKDIRSNKTPIIYATASTNVQEDVYHDPSLQIIF